MKVRHLVGLDASGCGPQPVRNRLAVEAFTDGADWVLPVDDDDVLRPEAVETLLAYTDGADVVYPWCEVVGRDDFWIVNKLFHAHSLHLQNFIPVTALVSRYAWEVLGGYRAVPLEDWDMWRRAELCDLRFVCCPEVLWEYRFRDGVNSFQAAA